MKKEIYFIKVSLENETLLILCHLDWMEYSLIKEYLNQGNSIDLSLIKSHNLSLFQNQPHQILTSLQNSEIKVIENVTLIIGFNPLETFPEELKKELASQEIYFFKNDEDAD